MNGQVTQYPDGVYTLKIREGVYRDVDVRGGQVFVRDGLAGGGTGVTLEWYEGRRGAEVLPFVIVPSNYSEVQNVR